MQIQSVVGNCTYLTKSADNFFCLILFACLFVSHEGHLDLKFRQAATVSRLKQLTTLLTLL